MESGISGAVAKTGDTMTGPLLLQFSTPELRFLDGSGDYVTGRIYNPEAAAGGYRLALVVRKTASNSASEVYFTPNATATSGTEYYYLLTTKEPVTIGQGGTGQTGVSRTTTPSAILTANNGFTVNLATLSVWGKVATLYAEITSANAISSSTFTACAQLKSEAGYPSTYIVTTTYKSEYHISITESGVIRVRGTVNASEVIYISATYIIA